MKIYHPYWLWEDYQNGMYREDWSNEDELINQSIDLLSDGTLFHDVLKKILIEWPVSCDENLSNPYQNRRAWLGRAACCYNHRCPEILTRKAWRLVNEKDKYNANVIANKIIKTYETRSSGVHKRMAKKMLRGNTGQSSEKIGKVKKGTIMQADMFSDITE